MIEKIKQFMFKNLFVVSKQPVLFRDLLEANCLYNEGMLVDPSKLNFRYRHRRFYAIYADSQKAIYAVNITQQHQLSYCIISPIYMTLLLY